MMAAECPAARFRPRPLSAFLAFLGFAILIALGTWQVERLHWKEGLIAERAARLAAPPLTLATVPKSPGAYDLRRIRLSGEFLNDKELVYGPRVHNGESGWRVVAPLRLDDGSFALVDRGWVPEDRKDRRSRTAGEPRGRVEIDGVLRAAPRRGWFTPDNVPAHNQWYTPDVAQMAAHLGLANVHPWLVEAGPAPNPGGFPIGGGTLAPLPNNHLQYAITWYALAAALVVIYILANRRRA
jgi:surfeit locus 1 family protein